MKLVIEVDDDIYKSIMFCKNLNVPMIEIEKEIANGIPLPKGHGRLIDADAFINSEECCGYIEDMDVDYFKQITPTIIPADKE